MYRVLVIALALVVAGCTSRDTVAEPLPSPSPTPSPTPAASPSGPSPIPTASLTGPLRVTAGMTRPGTRLRFGQKATVPIRQFNPRRDAYLEGVLGIVVQPIRSIPGSQVKGNFDARSAAELKRSRAYYVKIIITNESGNPLPLERPQFDGLYGDGDLSYNVLIGGEIPGCEEVGAPEAFDRKGARWETCDRWISSPSEPIRQVSYQGVPYGEAPKAFADSKFNRHYNLGPIVWR
ncbi:hypothetical protein ACTMTJ_26675 [Phytohabitans sp. LJ34]|uniref:hypothetical protein n=1 Tax=Phytohabitans sp. LJ34 TaxID=3452217 RepID=UPI003F8C8924